MTTEIEKQFFEAFGIEKKQVDCEQPERIYCPKSGCKTCKYSVYGYPEITDRILLELICILSQLQGRINDYYRIIHSNYEGLKTQILVDCICEKEFIKQQVKSLFKVG